MPLPEDAFDNERYRRGGTDSEALDPITRDLLTSRSIWRSKRHSARADAGVYTKSRRRWAAGYFAAFFLR